MQFEQIISNTQTNKQKITHLAFRTFKQKLNEFHTQHVHDNLMYSINLQINKYLTLNDKVKLYLSDWKKEKNNNKKRSSQYSSIMVFEKKKTKNVFNRQLN